MNKSTFVETRKNLKLKISYLILIFLFLSNLYITYHTELSFDECYYWVFSQFPSFGYFDHPPMVSWSISIGRFLFGHNEFAVRFMSQFYLIGTLFVLKEMLKQKLSNLNFVLLFISMPLLVTSGMIALPDTPLMFFSVLFFLRVRCYLEKDSAENVVALAVVIAAMFYSKYHGLLIVLLTVLGNPSFLKRKTFYMVALFVGLLFLPHMIWQYQHDFVSFKFHLFGRVEKHFDFRNILNYLGSQFLLMGFLYFPLFMYVFWKEKFSNPFQRILVFNSVGFLIFLFFMSFRNQIEANWTISCSIAFILLMSDYMSKYKKIFIWCSGVNVLLFLLLRFVLIVPEWFIEDGKENRLNEIYGWKKRVIEIKNLCGQDKIVGDNYQISSRMAFHLNQPEIPSLHYGSRESHYSILQLQKNIQQDEKICYLTSKNILNARKVESGYKDPVYVIQGISLRQLNSIYGATNEEIIRD